MKKEETKLTLILLLGGVGMISFLFFFIDIPSLPNLKFKSEALDITQYSKPYDYSTYKPHPLPKSSYKSMQTYSADNNGLMTDRINAGIPGRSYQNDESGYNFDNLSTMTGSTIFSQKNRIVGSTQGTGSTGGYYAYSSRGSSESSASGQASRGSMFAVGELREPFLNSTPTPRFESDISGQTSRGSMFAAGESRELFSNSTPLQRADYAPSDGGTDPGGDPTGPPLRVGNGLGVLLLLAAGYAVTKKGR